MKRLLIITLGILGGGVAYAADTCIKTTFNVTYSCGDGTLVGTLPENRVVEYGKSFTPKTFTTSICTPPAGGVIYGIDIYAGDKLLVSRADPSSAYIDFTYYYTTDITITPHYIRDIAPLDAIAANAGGSAIETVTDVETATWTSWIFYGIIKGTARLASIKPENTSTTLGYIPKDQDAIENDTDGGSYCYCKMTEPYLPDSPWIFATYGVPLASCLSNCASRQSRYILAAIK